MTRGRVSQRFYSCPVGAATEGSLTQPPKSVPHGGASLTRLARTWAFGGTGDFGTSDLVEDALSVIEKSGAQSVVPVALSHAGWVAIELRRILGTRVSKLVLLDWIILEAPAPFLGALGSRFRTEQSGCRPASSFLPCGFMAWTFPS